MFGELADGNGARSFSSTQSRVHSVKESRGSRNVELERLCSNGIMGDAAGEPSERHAREIFSAQSRVDGPGQSINGRQPIRSANASDRVVWAAAEFIQCTDGKARPIEPLAQQMANGLSLAMGIVRSLRDDEKETLINAARSTGFGNEVMCALRSGVQSSAVWQALGGRIGFPETTVLLAVMCEHSRELGCIFYSEAAGGQQIDEAAMRGLWGKWEAACSPYGRELSEQHAVELKNLVSKLSQETALLVMFNGFPLTHGAPHRVGLLRGYGNAIVPQVAAEFIKAAHWALTG
jgi:hypothetical protein